MTDTNPRSPVVLTDQARQLHRSCLIADGHNDLIWQVHKHGASFELVDLAVSQAGLQTDIPRLREGGLGAQFWAVYVPCSTMKTGGGVKLALEQIDLIQQMMRRYPDTFTLARSADDILRIHATNRIASLIGLEGGHMIESSLAVLRMFHELGAMYLTLTHADTTDWCDAATDAPRHGGLTHFGEQVIEELNRLGMIVDVSHVSYDAARHAVRVSRAPIIASHSAAATIAPHPRNLPDDVLAAIARTGGMCMVQFYSGMVDPVAAAMTQNMFEIDRQLRAVHQDDAAYRQARAAYSKDNPVPRGTIHAVVDHIDYLVKLMGVEHVGLGSDFDGVSTLPVQLDSVACYPFVTQALLDRGYRQTAIRKILGENLLRVLRQVTAVAGI